MFTGLIESVQPVKANTSSPSGRRLCLPLGSLFEGTRVGDSICVNGVCLTVSDLDDRRQLVFFDVMAETVRTTTLESLKPSDMVNLERALSAHGRLGGHILQGHVDDVGTVDQIKRDSSGCALWITAPSQVMRFIIEKGSIALDGVSLTVVDVEATRFSVNLIPTTFKDTNLGLRKTRDRVNLEADIISKWIRKRVDEILTPGNAGKNLTLEKLKDQGFI